MKRKTSKIFILTFFFFITSCASPIYKKVDKIKDKSNTNSSETVEYRIDKTFNSNELDCIAIGEIKDYSKNNHFKKLEKSKLIRKSIFGLLSVKNYNNIKPSRVDYIKKKYGYKNYKKLLKSINCDAIIIGKITKFRNDYFFTYSVTSIELELKLININSQELWAAKHQASSHEGSIPLSPLSLLSGVFLATSNTYDEKAFQMIDIVSRRMMHTFPSKEIIDLNNEILSNMNNNIDEEVVSIKDEEKNPNYLISNGKYEEALIVSQRLINKHPDKSMNYFLASKSEFMLNNYSSSIDYALKSIAKGNENPDVYSILGMSYLKREKNNLSYASFKKALKLDNKNSLANYNYAAIEEINQNWESASNHYYKGGLISIKEKDNLRIYNSLKSLKRLSKKNNYSKELYIKLGEKVNNYLKDN